ncbi:MAG: 5-formyltetrahydrofolate cyclo-ligase [Lachnospiraceae bacterium]|nr:5-formyltetrahydrofolate cyclo-ligase [Lachnospiraceae bacterium]
MIEEKKALRRKLKEKRESIPEELRKAYSAKILLNLDKTAEFNSAEKILLFANAGSEVITDDIFLYCIKKGISVYYPKVTGENMFFSRISGLNELVPGYWGIREPKTENENELLTDQDKLSNAVIICPGLGFTKEGTRIGYGGGYYDRFLSCNPSLYRLGVCFEAQICEHIPADENDFRMNMVVTEENIF